MYSAGEVIIYKTYNKYGDVIRREKRKIVRFLTNVEDKPIIEWESEKNSGICLPSTWAEWIEGVDENKQRELSVWRSATME